jgi:molybdenum cofactor cytidylyltransferase
MHQPPSDPLAAVVLAAGMSRRMGALKSVLPVGGVPLVLRTVHLYLAAPDVQRVYVVTGHAADQLAEALAGLDVQLVHNASHQAGEMLSSVQAGVAAAVDCGAAIIAAVDQPMVKAATIAALAGAWRETRARVVRPIHRGRGGHPVLLDLCGRDEIRALPRDATLKRYTHAHVERTISVDVDDPAILEDIDTPADYVRAMQMWIAQQRSGLCQSRTAAMPVTPRPVAVAAV